MSLQTFVANVRFAARTGQDTTIGGGIYTAKEMGEAAKAIDAVLAALNTLQASPNDPRAHRAALDAIKLAGGVV